MSVEHNQRFAKNKYLRTSACGSDRHKTAACMLLLPYACWLFAEALWNTCQVEGKRLRTRA